MTKTNRFILYLLILLMTMTVISGCASKMSDKGVMDSKPGGSMPNYGESIGADGDYDGDYDERESAPSYDDALKIITTVHMSFETTDFDETKANLEKLITKYKAYIEESNIYYSTHYDGRKYRNGEFVIRVPKKDVTNFQAELNGIGNMTSEQTRKEDVTKYYRDTESRLKVITTKEERILSLLEKATKIEDIIALENQLTEIIYEKEKLKSSLINIDDKVDYSTISMNIREVLKLSDQETKSTSYWTRIKNAAGGSIYGFIISMQDFLIWLIYALPTIIVLIVLYFIFRKVFKKVKFKNPFKKKDKS